MLLSPFVYSKAPFKHCKRALTVFLFAKTKHTGKKIPFFYFSTQGKQAPPITVLSKSTVGVIVIFNNLENKHKLHR